MAMMPAMPMPEAEMPEAQETGDLTEGYCIELSVLPDGTFKVSGPGPLKDDEYEEGADFTSIGDALKDVLRIIKENPPKGEDQANFEAGYAAR